MRLRERYLGLVCAGLIATGTCAQNPGPKAQTARPEIGRPLQAAIELLKQKKSREALARVRALQTVGDKTPYESYLVEHVLGQAAAAAGEHAAAARSFESVAASPAGPAGEHLSFVAAAASQYYLARNFAKAAELADRYLRQGGTDKSVRTIRMQALYLGNNFAAAARELLAEVEADEKTGKVPAEEQLNLLANACLQQRDTEGYMRAIEKLLEYHARVDYWRIAFHQLAARPGFPERLAIDMARLKLETGAMRSADEYLEAAQLSLQEGFSIEALRIIEHGYAAGLLGKGPQAARHRRLKDMASRGAAEDRGALAQDAGPSAAGANVRAIFNSGFNHVLHGNFGKGLAMMEAALREGAGIRHPEHARLQMAYALHLAGQNQKAVRLLRALKGADGTAALARLWAIRLGRTS